MALWYLNKKTNTARIYGGISAILIHEKPEVRFPEKKYKSKLTEHFSRKKLTIFEDDNYRIEKMEVITASIAREYNFK